MSSEQIAFALGMALMPLVLFLAMAFMALVRVCVARFLPDCAITRLLLARIDDPGGREAYPRGVGSGRGDLWAELTYEFRSLYK